MLKPEEPNITIVSGDRYVNGGHKSRGHPDGHRDCHTCVNFNGDQNHGSHSSGDGNVNEHTDGYKHVIRHVYGDKNACGCPHGNKHGIFNRYIDKDTVFHADGDADIPGKQYHYLYAHGPTLGKRNEHIVQHRHSDAYNGTIQYCDVHDDAACDSVTDKDRRKHRDQYAYRVTKRNIHGHGVQHADGYIDDKSSFGHIYRHEDRSGNRYKYRHIDADDFSIGRANA